MSVVTKAHKLELAAKIADVVEYVAEHTDPDTGDRPADEIEQVQDLLGDDHKDELPVLSLCAALASDLYDVAEMSDNYQAMPMPTDTNERQMHLLHGLVIQAMLATNPGEFIAGLLLGVASQNPRTDLAVSMAVLLIDALVLPVTEGFSDHLRILRGGDPE